MVPGVGQEVSLMRLMEMMLHIADENATEHRTRQESVPRLLVTPAAVEDREWATFKKRLSDRRKMLGIRDEELDDIEEDDIDILIVLSTIFEETKEPLVLSEVVRFLQRRKILALEFPASARKQTKRLLETMERLKRVKKDTLGRWWPED